MKTLRPELMDRSTMFCQVAVDVADHVFLETAGGADLAVQMAIAHAESGVVAAVRELLAEQHEVDAQVIASDVALATLAFRHRIAELTAGGRGGRA